MRNRENQWPKRVWISLLASLLLSACSDQSGSGSSSKAQEFHLYFTCDTSGRIEPCGCFEGQYGGLTRVSTVLKATPYNSIRVEVGNAIAGLEDYNVIQFKHLLKACHELGYHAINLGEREAQLSQTDLRDLAANSPVPLVSCNVLDADSREPVVADHVLVNYGTLKVAIIGAVDPDSLSGQPDSTIEVAGMAESVRRTLEAVGDTADIKILLAFSKTSGLEELANEFYEFDIVLGGDVPQPSSHLATVNRSLVYSTTNQARALGEIHAEFDPADGGRLGAPTGDIQLMRDTIRQDMAIKQHSLDYREEIRNAILDIDSPAEDASDRVPGVDPPSTYVGSSSCAGCHPTSFAKWQDSGHAHAFASLVKKDSEADPSCIECHVVGHGEPGGYRRAMGDDPVLSAVGCESCHGPASKHLQLQTEALTTGEEVLVKMRPVGEGQCIQCHHGEFSRPFDWNQFWPLIEHGKEPGNQ